MSTPSSFYEIVEQDANGNPVSFEKFRGKVVYGVNVASKCGYTASGYALLSKLAALKEKGVEVAIFPCNQVESHTIFSQ
jgi:glutathione peroxidase